MSLESFSPISMQPTHAQDARSTVFIPEGVCSKMINFYVEDGLVHDVKFTGGCPGNLEAIGRLVEGMAVEEVIEKLRGIRCGRKTTSCPDQLTRALEPYCEE